MSLPLTSKIDEGRSRECWETTDPGLIVKKPKADIAKHYPSLGFTVNFSGRVYRLLAYGTTDINRDEANIVDSLPSSIRSFVPETVRLEKQEDTSESLLIMSRTMDFDGQPSRTVQETGPIDNERFWQHVDELVQRMLENELYFCDIFWRGNNILVQRVNETEFRPVLVDVKRRGNSMYPYQLPLRFKTQLKEKFLRRLDSFKREFGGPVESSRAQHLSEEKPFRKRIMALLAVTR